MPTSLHIPKPLLEAVDARAKSLKISRNHFIVQTLQKEVTSGAAWSPGFFEALSNVEPNEAAAVDEMLDGIRKRRRSKAPLKL